MQTSPHSGLPPASVAPSTGSGSWPLPPLNQFLTLPRRFLSSNRPATMSTNRAAGNSATMDALLNADEDWTAPREPFPRLVRFQDVYERHQDADTGPAVEEIDLTVSSEDEDDGVEILDVQTNDAPLRRKRRRPGSAASDNGLLTPKRQRNTDVMNSAASTGISMHNSEVVEEFKRRLKCSICLDVLENMTSTICGHVFCAACIRQAIRANSKCPLCQRRLHLKDIHRLFF
ncbi:hypothetical protein V7S43_017799 [Phytophthora oleae]|uniref:RING-type domain-containing protein n=1 Tax=Phytophthora oleae TaxID=2107226 RepID=A0ABD3EUD7_9STRA